MTHLSDADLVTRALHGDAAAFGTLVERYQQAVYGVGVSLVHDFDLAQDLAQNAFLKAFQHLHRLAMPTHFGTWLRVITTNECRLYMRQARSAQALRRVHCDALGVPPAHLLPADQQWELHQQRHTRDRLAVAALQALERLSEKSRQAITLHAYEGDTIVAFWGAPVPTADHAVQGCLAALAIQARMAELHARSHQDRKPPVVRCGLQTGKLFVGEVGLRQQQVSTVWRTFGSVAEHAFNLERANKPLGTSILVGHETYAQAQGAVEARAVGQIKVRLYHPTVVMAYEVLARKGELAAPKSQAIARYLEGFTSYQTRQWEQALPAFSEALQLDPTDGPSRFYKERWEALLAAPPEVIAL